MCAVGEGVLGFGAELGGAQIGIEGDAAEADDDAQAAEALEFIHKIRAAVG